MSSRFVNKWILIVVVLQLTVLFVYQALAASDADLVPPTIELTSEEQAWLIAHPEILLAPDPDFPPIEWIDENGVYRGIAADFIRLLEKKLPIKFTIVHLENWNEVVRQAKSREIDMFGAAVPTPERLKYMHFTPPYVEFPAVVLVRESAEYFPVLTELKGKRVAVVSNYADHEYMRHTYPDIPLEVMPDISSGLRQVSFGKVDAMVLNLASASYYIQKDGITNLKITEDTDFVFDLSFAVRNDWPELISILNKGMASITPIERKNILSHWISLGKSSWKPPLILIVSVLSIILLFILLVILNWNRTLQKQVRERTADLESELAERIRSEKDKERLQLQVLRAKKMEALGLLAGGVAHDLNNILAGAVGYSDLVMRKLPKDSPIIKYFREIRGSGQRAAAVVEDLLTISRDAASDRKVSNLNIIVREYMDSAEHRALAEQYPDIVFSLDLADDLHNLTCSNIHVKKTIMNLMINAAEATRSGAVTIRTKNRLLNEKIDGHEAIKPGAFVQLAVMDTGSGISDEDLEHVFDPFYTRKKLGHSGTGLGLTVVMNTIQEHLGFIDVTRLAVGTCFELNFPASSEIMTITTEETLNENLLGAGEHILVIDDEENVRILAKRMLSHLKYQVTVAASGEEGLVFLRKNRVDLVLLDMLMDPGMNGYETYRRINLIRQGQKALIVSGFSESVDVEMTQALGAGGYLKKPYTLEELGEAVKRELKPESVNGSTNPCTSH